MNEKIDIEPKYLTPFKRFCMTIGELPTSYLETMTYYEMLVWFIKYLSDTVIPAINNNSDALKEIQDLMMELQNYVNNYFENLDVQEEINNKLDQMSEDGELAEIITEYLQFQTDNTLVNYANLKEKFHLDFSETDYYGGVSHTYQQGMCVINDSTVVVALTNQNGEDSSVRLVEYNMVNKAVVRSAYLQLYHANSLTYDQTNGKIYVAFCNQTEGGITTPNNNIGIVDYVTFTLENVVTPNNIPSGERIRSVYYDNEENVLYAGSYFKVFKLNNVYSITETITLNTSNIDSTIDDYNLNQTFKVKDDKIYGLFMSFVGIWKDDGTLLKVINLSSPTDLQNIGEFEDFDFLSNGNALIATTKRESVLSNYRLSTIYATNFIKNVDVNIPFTRLNNDTNVYTLYVDGSYVGDELGTESRPFKSLQKAVNYARQLKTSTEISIAAGSYSKIYLQGVYNLTLTLRGVVTIDGIRCWKSSLYVYNPAYNLRINGIDSQMSNISMRTTGSAGDIDIYDNSDTDTFYSCINATDNSKLHLQHVSFIGSDTRDLVNISQSMINLNECSFASYAGQYAILGTRNSIICCYDNTYGETVTSSQHIYRLASGSILFKKASDKDINAITLESQSFDFPSLRWCGGVSGDGYTGTLVTGLDTHYNAIVLRCRTSGTTAKCNYFVIPYLENTDYTVNGQWLNSTYVNNCMICVSRANNNLVIEYNRLSQTTLSTGVTKFYSYGDAGAPADSAFMQVLDVGYLNI